VSWCDQKETGVSSKRGQLDLAKGDTCEQKENKLVGLLLVEGSLIMVVLLQRRIGLCRDAT